MKLAIDISIYNQYFGDAGPEQSLVLLSINLIRFLPNAFYLE